MQIRSHSKACHLPSLWGFLFSAQPVQTSKGHLQPAPGSKVSLINVLTITLPPSDGGLLLSLEIDCGCCQNGCFFPGRPTDSYSQSLSSSDLFFPPAASGLSGAQLSHEKGAEFVHFQAISHQALSPSSWQLPLWLWCEWE